MGLKEKVKEYAKTLGIDLFAVAPVEVYSEYLAETKNRMSELEIDVGDYMLNGKGFFSELSRPESVLPSATSIIILGVYSYDKNSDYANAGKELRCKTARTYSYYPVARILSEQLVEYIESLGYKTAEGQNIPLKHAADRIGLGSYGKNGVLLTEEYGSFAALRCIITDMPIASDKFEKKDLCTGCEACLKACPTGALYAPYKVNPKLCLNPIGRRDDYIAPDMRGKMRNWLRGCDICQDVCPVNKGLVPREVHSAAGFDPQNHGSHKDLGGLEKCPEALEIIKKGYPMTIRRNAVIALANTARHDDAVIVAIENQMGDMGEELKEYFVWAAAKLRAKKPL